MKFALSLAYVIIRFKATQKWPIIPKTVSQCHREVYTLFKRLYTALLNIVDRKSHEIWPTQANLTGCLPLRDVCMITKEKSPLSGRQH